MTGLPNITIADEVTIPQLGLGVFQMSEEEAASSVSTALEFGYRSIDTASIYGNEQGTGQGLRDAGLKRETVFITTKLWNDRQSDARTALMESLKKLQLDYLDLFLIHWPAPKANAYVRAWHALISLRADGLCRAIGVSNFTEAHLSRVIEETGVKPAVNQIELHPYFQQREVSAFHAKHGITTEAWSPIGQGKALLGDPLLKDLASKHGKTPAQIVLRWHLHLGHVVIPKSVTPSRIRENIDITTFALDEADMAAIRTLDRGQRLGPNPDDFG